MLRFFIYQLYTHRMQDKNRRGQTRNEDYTQRLLGYSGSASLANVKYKVKKRCLYYLSAICCIMGKSFLFFSCGLQCCLKMVSRHCTSLLVESGFLCFSCRELIIAKLSPLCDFLFVVNYCVYIEEILMVQMNTLTFGLNLQHVNFSCTDKIGFWVSDPCLNVDRHSLTNQWYSINISEIWLQLAWFHCSGL